MTETMTARHPLILAHVSINTIFVMLMSYIDNIVFRYKIVVIEFHS